MEANEARDFSGEDMNALQEMLNEVVAVERGERWYCTDGALAYHARLIALAREARACIDSYRVDSLPVRLSSGSKR